MFQIETIVHWFRKHFTLSDILLIGGIVVLYVLTRTINLENVPIFSDEGIYIRWAEVAWKDAQWRFISLTDGKQPLQTWGTIPFLKLFPNESLIAGRLFSVATGLVALFGMFTLLFYFFNKKTAYIGSLLYLVTPYFLFYDRMALVDSGVNAGFIWMLFFSVLLARTRRLDVALLFGLVTGMSLLAKSSVRLFGGLSTLAPILFFSKKPKQFILNSLNYYLLFAVVSILGLALYNIQRLSPYFHYVGLKNTTFVMSMAEFRQNPFMVLFSNLQTIPVFVFWELGWLIVPIGFLGYFILWKKDWKLFLYLLAWLIVPYILVALVSKVLFPRYLIFFGSLFLIMASYFLGQLRSKKQQIFLTLFIMVYQIIYSYPILFDITKLNFPLVDRGQYIEGATAVWGAKDLVNFVREKSTEKPVLLMAEGDFGLVADVLRVYVNDTDKIEVKGLWPLGEEQIMEYQKETADRQVYMVFSHTEVFPEHWPIKLVKKYPKPGNQRILYLFEYK